MKHPPELVEKARDLRRQGYGYEAIAKAIGVVLSTAYRWTRDLPIVTADAFDGRCRPLSSEHRARLSASQRKNWGRVTSDQDTVFIPRSGESRLAIAADQKVQQRSRSHCDCTSEVKA